MLLRLREFPFSDLLDYIRRLLCRYFGSTAGWIAAACSKTVILVRHADYDGNGDLPLNAAGVARAQALAHVTESVGIDAIFVTQFIRSHETAAPTEAASGVTAEEISYDDRPLLVQRIRAQRLGSTTLVIGHSDSVPAVIEDLGLGSVPAIDTDEFDNLYVARLGAGSLLIHLHYGAET